MREFSNEWLAFLRLQLGASDVQLTGTDIDWLASGVYYKSIVANTTFTFSNLVESAPVNVIIRNSNSSEVTVTWPAGVIFDEVYQALIQPSCETVFTFNKANNKIYCTSVNNMTNV